VNRALRASEQATEAIVARRVRWCRAKLLHALAGAAEQGVPGEVLSELVPAEADLAERIATELRATGWLSP
jgi:hypothetical protein